MRLLFLIAAFISLSCEGQIINASPSYRARIAAESGAAFLTSTPSSSLRNNFSGYVGFLFTVGISDITVTHLGRWVVSGNSGTHNIMIATISGGTFTSVLTTSINTSGLSVGYNYVSITPTTLTAGVQYIVWSEEASAGDQWYDVQTVTTTAVGVISNSVYQTGGNTYATATTGVDAFVPVNFKY